MIKMILITYDTNNIASVHVIEKNSGQLRSQAMVDGYDKLVERYWIDL